MAGRQAVDVGVDFLGVEERAGQGRGEVDGSGGVGGGGGRGAVQEGVGVGGGGEGWGEQGGEIEVRGEAGWEGGGGWCCHGRAGFRGCWILKAWKYGEIVGVGTRGLSNSWLSIEKSGCNGSFRGSDAKVRGVTIADRDWRVGTADFPL